MALYKRMLDLDAYFRRIGYDGSRAPTLGTLRALQGGHALAIPFENLESVAGRAVPLDLASLQRKLVDAGRGGYCFEQNLLFAHVLSTLGFDVTALAARVLWERPADEVRARTHMLLLVALPEGRYLCDVGFGGLTPTAPLALDERGEQATPHETFRVVPAGREFLVEARLGGDWRPLYRFDLQPQHQVDIELLNFYVASHRESPMLGRLIAARAAPDRRFALRDATFTVHHVDGRREQRTLDDVEALRAVLESVFGIALRPDPALEAALGRLFGAS